MDSQLLHTFRFLNQDELETLDLFVASSIFQPKQQGDQTVKLFVEIKKYYPVI